MRLAYIVNNPDFFLSHRLQLALDAKKSGWQVYVVCPEGGSQEKIEKLGFTVTNFYLERKSLNPFVEVKTLISLFRTLRVLNLDIIHAIGSKAIIYSCLLQSFLKVKKVVGTLTGLGYVFTKPGIAGGFWRFIVGSLYRLSLSSKKTFVIFQNSEDMKLFLQNHWLEESRATLIKGSGVDLQKFFATPEPAGVPRILFPARMLKDKGLVELVAAAKHLRGENLKFELILAGSIDANNPSGVSSKEIAEWEDQGLLKWVGFQSDMFSQYREANIICLPSYREGLPLSLLEASACERAIVTTDVPGCREIVEHQVNGLLVRPRDVEDLIAALKQLIVSPELRRKYAKAAYVKVLSGYSIDHVIKATKKIYLAN